MNELYIQQVLEIEKHAQMIHENAQHEAQLLAVQAEQEAQELIEKARVDSEAEARKLIEDAQAQEEIARIIAQADEITTKEKTLAASHFDQAVEYVLNQVAGKR